MNGCVWGPPISPWNEISLERTALVQVVVVEAPDHDVRDVREPSVRRR